MKRVYEDVYNIRGEKIGELEVTNYSQGKTRRQESDDSVYMFAWAMVVCSVIVIVLVSLVLSGAL